MLDLLLAGYIARSYRRRAVARRLPATRVALAVFFVIIGTEVAGIVAMAMAMDRSRVSMLLGAVGGVAIGALLGTLVGEWMTPGSPVEDPDEDDPETRTVAGAECYECQKTIDTAADGRPCAVCVHVLHNGCWQEHRAAHRAFEKAQRKSARRAG